MAQRDATVSVKILDTPAVRELCNSFALENSLLKQKLEEVRKFLSVRRVAELGGNWDESTRALENEYTLHAIEEIVFLDNKNGAKK